jgi:hypothetical protein
MSKNHLETCLYHLVGITEPVFKRLSATYDTACIDQHVFTRKLEKNTSERSQLNLVICFCLQYVKTSSPVELLKQKR